MNQIDAHGGTELLFAKLQKHLSKGLLAQVSISTKVPQHAAHHIKPSILWEHQSYDQPSVQRLSDKHILAAIDRIVFVSEWQKGEFLKHFSIPTEKVAIIRNAIEPIPEHIKPQQPLRLIYTSTPFRGLDVLLDAFKILNDDNIELHIYSGMSLYGSDRVHEDARFEELYAKARSMRGVFYHGVVPNDEVRSALQEAHIFAYPNTWEETSCLSLIEALSAGCLAVIPEFGALPETASSFAQLYLYTKDKEAHVRQFAAELRKAIDSFWDEKTQERLKEQRGYFAANYAWGTRKNEWERFLIDVMKTYGKTV